MAPAHRLSGMPLPTVRSVRLKQLVRDELARLRGLAGRRRLASLQKLVDRDRSVVALKDGRGAGTLMTLKFHPGTDPMPMAEHSILVGKSYRTPHDEVREVSGMDKGDVLYRLVPATPGPELLGAVPQKRLPLAQFAAEVESEISPDAV